MEAMPVDGEFAYAPWWRRILSSVLDSLVISVLSVPFAGAAVSRFFEAVSAGNDVDPADLRTITVTNVVVTVAYMTAMHAWRGASVGKMALRLVLVRDDGSRVSGGTAFVRAVTIASIQFVSSWLFLPMLINEMWPLWNTKRQTLHDVVAKTIVVPSGTTRPVPPS